MRVNFGIIASVVSIAFFLSGCGATNVRTSPHNISALGLKDPFANSATVKMLYGVNQDSPKAAYVTENSTLTVSCGPTTGRPIIEIDKDNKGAALYCGRWPLWHVEFSQKLKTPLRKKWTSDNNRRRIHLKIPGIWD